MQYFIVDALPPDFGTPYVIAVCANKKDADLLMDFYKGVNRDSYSHQYVKLLSRRRPTLFTKLYFLIFDKDFDKVL